MLSEDMRQFWRNSDLGCRDELGKAINSAKEIRDSSKLAGIMNLRHKHLAHSLAHAWRKEGYRFPAHRAWRRNKIVRGFYPDRRSADHLGEWSQSFNRGVS